MIIKEKRFNSRYKPAAILESIRMICNNGKSEIKLESGYPDMYDVERARSMTVRLKPLIQRAVLDVHEFGYHTRTELNHLARTKPFYIMSYLKEGEALLRIDGKEYFTKAGSVVLIPPFVEHDHIKITNEESTFLWWHFNFVTPWNIDILRFLNLPVVTYIENSERFEKTFIEYLEAIDQSDTLPDFIYKNAKGLEVLASLFENVMSSEYTSLRNDIPDVFFDVMDDILTEPTASKSLTAIAAKYHMNPSYLSSRFKEYFGISPIFLHRELLAERAKELLITSSLNIGEIAEKLGFSDVAVFTRFFSERTGISPSKYRNTK